MKIGDAFRETAGCWAIETEVLGFDPGKGYVIRRKWKWLDAAKRQYREETAVMPEERLKEIAVRSGKPEKTQGSVACKKGL